ncbi:MAG: DUF1559 family PulG-like putative transporter [Planctomycetales bacterium]|jgi:hypothetical protein
MKTESPSTVSKRKSLPFRAFKVVVGLAVCFGLGTVLLESIQQSRSTAYVPRCQNHLKTLMMAVHNYHDDFGSLPPPYTIDADGRKLHSWRTLLLPYLDAAASYEKLRLDEPWDSPHNVSVESTISARTKDYYACPQNPVFRRSKWFDTNYFAVLGPRTIWSTDGPVSLDDVVDGTQRTICIIEVAGSGVHWMEPRDIHFDRLSFEVNGPSNHGLSSHHGSYTRTKHAGVCHVGVLDGSVFALPASIFQRQLQELLIIDDDAPALDWRESLR